MKFLITRPEPGASETANALAARGYQAVIDPMLEIVFDDVTDLDPARYQAIAVTSGNAIIALARNSMADKLRRIPFYCVGDRTAAAGRAAGFTSVKSAGGDVDGLTAMMLAELDSRNGAILYAAGRDRTGDLDVKLADQGFDVSLVEVYRAEARPRLGAETVGALDAGSLDGILIFSARTAATLVRAARASGRLDRLRDLPIHTISRNAAKPLEEAGFSTIVAAPRPDQHSLISCLPTMPSK